MVLIHSSIATASKPQNKPSYSKPFKASISGPPRDQLVIVVGTREAKQSSLRHFLHDNSVNFLHDSLTSSSRAVTDRLLLFLLPFAIRKETT